MRDHTKRLKKMTIWSALFIPVISQADSFGQMTEIHSGTVAAAYSPFSYYSSFADIIIAFFSWLKQTAFPVLDESARHMPELPYGWMFIITVGVILAIWLLKALSARARLANATGDMMEQAEKAEKFSLQTSNPLGIYLTTIIAGVMVASFSWWNQMELEISTRADVGKSLELMLDYTGQDIRGWLKQKELEAGKWASGEFGMDRISLDLTLAGRDIESLWESSAQRKLRNYLLNPLWEGGYEGYMLVGPEKTIIASDNKNELTLPVDQFIDSRFIKEAFTPPAYTALTVPRKPQPDSLTSRMILVGAAVRDESNKPMGLLILKLDPAKTFSSLFERARINESSETLAFNQAGLLVTPSRHEGVLKKAGLIAESQSSVLNVYLRNPGSPLAQQAPGALDVNQLPLTLMAEAATAGKSGVNIAGYQDYRGEPVVAAWEWLDEYGMGLVTKVDYKEAYTSITRTRQLASTVTGFTIALMLLMALMFVWNRRRMALANTRLLESERAIADQLAYQAALLDAVPNPIFVKNTEGIFTACNRAFEEAFNITREKLAGRTRLSMEKVNEEESRAQHESDLKLLRSGGFTRDETCLTFADGKRHDVMYWRRTFNQADGNPGGMLGILIDITERKQAEEAVQKAMKSAEDANTAKSRFLANMSHELRTPMNAIIGYSEMLAEDAEDEGYDEMIPDLNKIAGAGRHLLSLINDVLDLSKIEAGRMEIYVEEFQIQELFGDVKSTTSFLVGKNNNEFALDFPEDVGTMHADVTKIRQCVMNLISNAAKFTENGTITLGARKEKRKDKEWTIIWVQDTGIGIPDDKIDHVFEEFTQADESTTRNYGGTGLGLPLSKKFCQMMGGTLYATSEAGKGSRFIMELPTVVVKIDENAAEKVEDESLQSELALSHQVEEVPGDVVLIIDDDPYARELMNKALSNEGFHVVTATNGDEGLMAARTLMPSLITLDVIMPHKDGWTVLQELKQDEQLKDIPVVMVSFVSDHSTGVSLGAVESLSKPIDKESLLGLVKRYATADHKPLALVVEDDMASAGVALRVLKEAGWSAVHAENGKIGLAKIKEQKPDLILLDLMMPVMDGFDFVGKLRKDEINRDIPVVVVTAKDLTEDDHMRLKGGVEMIVQKDEMPMEEVITQVRDLVLKLEGRPESVSEDEQAN